MDLHAFRPERFEESGTPATEEIKIVFNAKHEEYLQDIVLPPRERG